MDSHTEARKLTGLFGNNVLTVLRRNIKCHEDEEYYSDEPRNLYTLQSSQ